MGMFRQLTESQLIVISITDFFGPLNRKCSPVERRSITSQTHYHIQWSDSSLDWKPFPTKEEAENLARQIKKSNETFVIVERDRECERCKALRAKS